MCHWVVLYQGSVDENITHTFGKPKRKWVICRTLTATLKSLLWLQARLAALRGELRNGLSTLPAPANEYMLQIPAIDESQENDGTDAMEEDAVDVKARLKVLLESLVVLNCSRS
jgi:hypothetical protein